MDPFCYLCFMSVMLSFLIIAALCPPTGKGITFSFVFVTFSCGVLGQVWYLIVSLSPFLLCWNILVKCFVASLITLQ